MKKYTLFVFVFLLYSYSVIECNEYKQEKELILKATQRGAQYRTITNSTDHLDEKDKYDLTFSHLADTLDDNSAKWDVFFPYPIQQKKISICNTSHIGGKHPTKISVEREKSDPIEYYLGQIICIPDGYNNKGEEIAISINSKTNNMDSLLLSVMLLDAQDRLETAQTVQVGGEDWNTKSIKLKTTPTSKNIRLQLKAFSSALKDANGSLLRGIRDTICREVLLDRMDILIDKTPINNLPKCNISNICNKDIALEIDVNAIINLESKDSDGGIDCSKLPEPINKKLVVGLGESVHGASEISKTVYEIIKDQVEHHSCKIILFESSMTSCLYLDMFIQGRLPNLSVDETLEYIKNKGILNAEDGSQNLKDFLLFLRNYNYTANEKVHIWGVDALLFEESAFNYFADYILGFTDEKNIDVLKDIVLGFDNPIQYADKPDAFVELLDDKQKEMKTIMGEDNYKVFRLVYNRFSVYNDTLPYILENKEFTLGRQLFSKLFFRDTYKWDRTKSILKDFPLSPQRRMLIYMHEGHLNKIRNNYPYPIFSPKMYGGFLNEYFGEEYYVVNILIGKGERKIVNKSGLGKEIVKYAPANSVEGSLFKHKFNYSYYPTSKLPDSPFYIRHLGFNADQEQFILLKDKSYYDGLLFVQKTQLSKETQQLLEMSQHEIDSTSWQTLILREKGQNMIGGH